MCTGSGQDVQGRTAGFGVALPARPMMAVRGVRAKLLLRLCDLTPG